MTCVLLGLNLFEGPKAVSMYLMYDCTNGTAPSSTGKPFISAGARASALKSM